MRFTLSIVCILDVGERGPKRTCVPPMLTWIPSGAIRPRLPLFKQVCIENRMESDRDYSLICYEVCDLEYTSSLRRKPQ